MVPLLRECGVLHHHNCHPSHPGVAEVGQEAHKVQAPLEVRKPGAATAAEVRVMYVEKANCYPKNGSKLPQNILCLENVDYFLCPPVLTDWAAAPCLSS